LPPLPDFSDLAKQLQPLGTVVFTNFFAFFSNSLTALLQLLLVLVLAIMMLANPREYRNAFVRLFPSFYRRRADEILTRSESALGNWLLGIAISSTTVAFLSGIGLFALQIPLVLVHALLAGLLNFIPNIGPTASVIFPIMVALLGPPWKIAAILILYFIIQNVESYLLTPTVMAKQVSLLPAITLIAQIFFAQMFGLLGLLLALPLTVVAKTWIEELLFKDILDRWRQPRLSPSIDSTED
jgi:predicted PurR-regulated permease PerM